MAQNLSNTVCNGDISHDRCGVESDTPAKLSPIWSSWTVIHLWPVIGQDSWWNSQRKSRFIILSLHLIASCNILFETIFSFIFMSFTFNFVIGLIFYHKTVFLWPCKVLCRCVIYTMSCIYINNIVFASNIWKITIIQQ